MEGIRITQLKQAMKSILSELKPEDVFNIVEFNSNTKVWNIPAVAVQHESATRYWYGADEDLENPFKNRTVRLLFNTILVGTTQVILILEKNFIDNY